MLAYPIMIVVALLLISLFANYALWQEKKHLQNRLVQARINLNEAREKAEKLMNKINVINNHSKKLQENIARRDKRLREVGKKEINEIIDDYNKGWYNEFILFIVVCFIILAGCASSPVVTQTTTLECVRPAKEIVYEEYPKLKEVEDYIGRTFDLYEITKEIIRVSRRNQIKQRTYELMLLDTIKCYEKQRELDMEKTKCKEKMEVYSRIVGYYRPTCDWNKGKLAEYKLRKPFSTNDQPKPSHPSPCQDS